MESQEYLDLAAQAYDFESFKDFLHNNSLNKESKADMYNAIVIYANNLKQEETNKTLIVELDTQYNFVVGIIVCIFYLVFIWGVFKFLTK